MWEKLKEQMAQKETESGGNEKIMGRLKQEHGARTQRHYDCSLNMNFILIEKAHADRLQSNSSTVELKL